MTTDAQDIEAPDAVASTAPMSDTAVDDQPGTSEATTAQADNPGGGSSESTSTPAVQHSILDSSFPVLLPYDDALFMNQEDFDALVKKLVGRREPSPLKRSAEEATGLEPAKKAPFIQGLEKHNAHIQTLQDLAQKNLALTENADVTHVSAQNSLVDLFYDLKNDGSVFYVDLFEKAWAEDALMTLKIIFNARSIHLGKSDRIATYHAFGWLAEHHPHTLLTNLVWLVRPVIEKKASSGSGEKNVKKDEAEDQSKPGLVMLGGPNTGVRAATEQKPSDASPDEDFDMIDAEEAKTNEAKPTQETVSVKTEDDETNDPLTAHDVRFGMSHGYYKDLLNLVVFAANDQLTFEGDPSVMLTQKQDRSKHWRAKVEWDFAKAKEKRQLWKKQQHERVVYKLQNDHLYRALHITVARIFAQQLQEDRKLLDSGKPSQLRKLSLAAKWVPTYGSFHDKWSFILSTIAEILYPNPAEITPDASNRELYLRCAREAFRKNYSSPLRKALAVVERDIAAQTFSKINYERVPSLAMDRYTKTFMEKDRDHFLEYVQRVTKGKAKISGATLLPSNLIAKARVPYGVTRGTSSAKTIKALVEGEVVYEIINGQWKTLVQRIKDSGALGSSIAVCDVSGSMLCPRLEDGTTPMDSSIGLSLLVSEVTAPPFGGGFITFSAKPQYITVGGPEDTRSLVHKVRHIEQSEWGYNTNLVAVFEDVILPMAVANKLKQEDMVKQVFMFSDMQFDQATEDTERWTTSYERIKKKYEEAGYEMPMLIFWNLAGSHTSKPVTVEDQNTALVSGYSQGMLKVFLDGGGFTDEIGVVEKEGEDGVMEVEKRPKKDPLAVVKKTVSHKAYSMLRVVD